MTSFAERMAERFWFAMLHRMAGGALPEAELRRNVRVTMSEMPNERGTWVHLRPEHDVTSVHVRLNARSGEPVSWYVDALAEDGDESLSAEECLGIATAAAAPPDGAVLRVARYERAGGRTFFVALWEHEHEGVLVEGDGIEVLINARAAAPFSWRRMWHTPRPEHGFEER